jgi:hypothetical protein
MRYGLGPEAAKSMLYMWRASRDPKFRTMGWNVFQAIMRHARTPHGAFATVQVLPLLPWGSMLPS